MSNLKKYDFINIELKDAKFVGIITKNSKDELTLLPLFRFSTPEGISNESIIPMFSVLKSSITAYNKLSKKQLQNLIYLLDMDNIWIKRAIEKALK
jgi:hypothetical protein